MADSFQSGRVTTLQHNPAPSGGYRVRVKSLLAIPSIGLILPALYSELERPALANIVDELEKVPYLRQVVIGIDRASEDEYRHALQYFSRLPQDFQVLWNDGPNLKAIDDMLPKEGLAPQQMEQGRNVW